MADHEAVLAAYSKFDFTDGGRTYPVYRRGSGPAVIIMHEMPGLHPLVVRFADRVAAAGMTVFCPSFFGKPGKPVDRNYVTATALGVLCMRREFYVWRGASTPNAGARGSARSACASPATSRWP